MNRVVFDLDGVARDLQGTLEDKYNFKIRRWDWKLNDVDIYGLMKKDMSLLVTSRPTEYIKVVRKYLKNSEIWTHQPESWIPFTKKWIKKYLGNPKINYLTSAEKFTELKRSKNIYLVEDYPNFESYERIILIDKTYNRKTLDSTRVSTPEQLDKTLKKILASK